MINHLFVHTHFDVLTVQFVSLFNLAVHNVLYVYVYGKAEHTFPPLLLPGGVLVVWLCVL